MVRSRVRLTGSTVLIFHPWLDVDNDGTFLISAAASAAMRADIWWMDGWMDGNGCWHCINDLPCLLTDNQRPKQTGVIIL